uniref:hypothetical protein n=1 Tax=Thermogemmatispora sp. TaxID=1968838 RepID=UPI002ACC318D
MDIVPGNHYMHLHSNGDPAQLIASIQQKVLAPLRAFRQQVAPLNDTQITCVQSCATALAALFEGRR